MKLSGVDPDVEAEIIGGGDKSQGGDNPGRDIPQAVHNQARGQARAGGEGKGKGSGGG
ncbi:hypothetical protein [Thermococcus sp. JCM 11816]|uniref:hypothetical protein n=1 Tax=Thermococcus sp. (strain JCM 11816 / KS-1) TaxID=1295125 RepID=UPI0034652FA8